jgi:hypothetical protein
MSEQPDKTINDLFPVGSRLLLTGGGKDFIERIGVEATRQVIHSVMIGENLRSQTEPLTRRRVAQVSGAIIALFARGHLEVENFASKLSGMAVEQLRTARRDDKASIWTAQWLIGLTGKSVQNVLRSKSDVMEHYLTDFEAAVQEAAQKCRAEMGDLKMTLGFVENGDQRAELDWTDITKLTTAVGAQTLAIRGSDKSIYGKLFERLILGSFLTILGFERVDPKTNTKIPMVFWLSDSSDNRESDATVRVSQGRLARFDIGFIGVGNSEISKDKLSRYGLEVETLGVKSSSVTFIVVDRLPKTGKTQTAATKIGAEIVQMSMQYWVRDLAQRMGDRLKFTHELQTLPDAEISDYLTEKLAVIPVQDFLIGVAPEELDQDTELPEAAVETEAYEDED